MSTIPVDGLHHVTVVVRDARASAAKFAAFYGIAAWDVRACDASRLRDMTTHGFAAEHHYRSATGVLATASGPLRFVLVEPLGGWTTYHEFLNTRGEGIHSICTAVVTPDDAAELARGLAAHGVGVAQSARQADGTETWLFDTRAKLGGFYIEILAERVHGAAAHVPVDEVWDLRAQAGDSPPMQLDGIKHFGVVVPDLMAAVRGYAELFGITKYTFRNWRNAPGSLDDPTYLGRPVDHAYFTTMVTPAESVAFEVIQPTLGPTHYNEDFLQRIGPGIHHIHGGMLPDAAAWNELAERMERQGVPMVMSGGILNRYIDFYYLDTRAALAGYVTEFVVPGINYANGRPNVPFAMTADLSQPIDARAEVPA
jgi:hypothetical protein